MFMLPSDPAWRRDLQATVEWWTGSDPVQEELDAALSHMLRPKEEERVDRPAVLILAMRFKDEDVAEEIKLRIQHRFRRPDVRITRAKRIVLLQAPLEGLPKDCADALWDEEVSRLRRIAD